MDNVSGTVCSHSRCGRAHSLEPAPRAATLVLPGSTAPDPALAIRPARARSAPAQAGPHRDTAPLEQERPPRLAAPTRIMQLPDELLHQIFTALPLSSHSACAQVCRRWYANLPATRIRLALWLEQRPFRPRLADLLLAEGFGSRTGPELARQGSPWLGLMAREYQAMRPLAPPETGRQAAAPQQNPAAQRFLSGLLQYSLQQHLVQAHKLELRPVPFLWSCTELLRSFSFSGCSRRLATCCQEEDAIYAQLRLYDWSQGRWHEEKLTPEPTRPLTTFTFCRRPSDVLVSAHDRDLLAWRKNPATGSWCCSGLLRCRVAPFHKVQVIVPMADGDLIVFAPSLDCRDHALQLLFFRYLPPRNGNRDTTRLWEQTGQHSSTGHCVWGWASEQGLLALANIRTDLSGRRYTDSLILWKKGLRPDRPQAWDCKTVSLPCEHHCALQLCYSPDGCHLLALLDNSEIRLWRQSPGCRLEEQLRVPVRIPQGGARLKKLVPFRRDGQQLAVPCSLRRIQFWNRRKDGRWSAGDILDNPSPSQRRSTEAIKAVLLSDAGDILVQQTSRELAIWYKDRSGRWQLQVERKAASADAALVFTCLLPGGQGICTTVADTSGSRQVSLWLHAPDSCGQLVRKACLTIAAPVLGCSPDGLSLLLGGSASAAWGHPQVNLLQVMAVPPENPLPDELQQVRPGRQGGCPSLPTATALAEREENRLVSLPAARAATPATAALSAPTGRM